MGRFYVKPEDDPARVRQLVKVADALMMSAVTLCVDHRVNGRPHVARWAAVERKCDAMRDLLETWRAK